MSALAQIIVGAVASVTSLSLGGDFENPWAVIVLTITTQLVLRGIGYLFVPDKGKLFATVLLAAGLGIAVYGHERLDQTRLRYLAYAPAGIIAVLVVVSGIAEIESVAGGLFVATHFTVLALAADTYDRTESLIVPATAYLSLLIANRLVVVGLEAGKQSW